MQTDMRDYLVEAILRDGRSVYIRALKPDDRQGLLDLFSQLSPRSVYFRFFRFKKWLTEAELTQFTDLDFRREAALVAAFQEAGRERIFGVGRYFALPEEGSGKAEIALAVADAFQGKGAGTLLLEHLAVIARRNGVAEFGADVLEENTQMIELLTSIGFKMERCSESGVSRFSFPTDLTREFVDSQTRRERLATAASVRVFLQPRSIAIVGASRKHGTIGAALLGSLKRCGFRGTLYPVNPGTQEIDGIRAFPTVSSIQAPVDMALIAVPAAAAEDAVRDCARAGVRSLVVISAGFGEVSAEGREMERRLRQLARSSGMRMVGPNSMGVINTAPDVSMNANFAPVWPPAGGIGLLSQSGALGYGLLDLTPELNVGISTFVSAGNKADISVNDLLAYWSEDPATQVIMLYLESFDQASKFARLAPEIARRKPIVAVKSGRTNAGSRAASSHTAALASSDTAVDALFDQSGIIRAATVEQLLDVTRFLSSQPLPPGKRVGAITNAGGPGILLADACEAQGLVLPEYAAATKDALRAFLPKQAGLANPIDMIASATPEQYARAIEIAAADPNMDALIMIYLPPRLHPPEEMIKAMTEAVEKVPTEKPVLGVFMSSRGVPPVVCKGPRGRIPLYGFPDNAAVALASAYRYASWRSRPAGTVLTIGHDERREIRNVVDRALESSRGPLWLGTADLARILRAAGIDFAAAEEAGLDEAGEAADRLGYPLVAKVQAEGVIHKSDVGGVMLGLSSRAEVEHAAAAMAERMKDIGIKLERVLLQREIRGGIEALVGVTVDANFGPMLACGFGGVLVEVIKDVAFRLPPVSDIDAEDMIGKLRAAVLLDGYRAAPPGDRKALVQLLQRVSALIEVIPELLDLDLNPIKVLPPGRGAIAVDARMRIARWSASGDAARAPQVLEV